MIKEFLVTIIAYGYHTKFPIKANDAPEAIEQSIVDKLGENSVKWEQSGFFDKARKWITYEEVVYDPRPIQTKNVLGVELATRV
jgi:hypothetical protein|tara:strand:+ start:144 stop:395 length:252 start_codon:yes stop_codon:yes gene_type:complete